MVKIYTMEDCPYCKELKEMYDKGGVEYTEVDINIEENREEYEMVSKVGQSDSVPLVRVHNQVLAPDVSFSSITEAFELTERFLNS